MERIIKNIILALSCIAAAQPSDIFAASKKKKKQKKNDGLSAQVIRLKRDFVLRERPDSEIWNDSVSVKSKIKQLDRERQVDVWQLQSDLLLQAGYPILAAQYSGEALRLTKQPLSTTSSRAWEILAKVSKAKPIQDMIEELAIDLKLRKTSPPAFGQDWKYFLANALTQKNETKRALDLYSDIKMGERYFLPAKYQMAMIHIQNDQLEKAENELKIMLREETLESSPLKSSTRNEINNLGRLALARVLYGQKQFMQSAAQFRLVDRDSPWFYDALSEQAWALFMAGFPNHALGSLYGAESPFFADVYNPEISMQRSIIFYWMCRYDDARNALADFTERYGKTVEGLANFLDRKRLTPDSAYELFENLITGVSSESLKIPRESLQTAAEHDSMLLIRDQYASLITEIDRMENKGVFNSKSNISEAEQVLRQMQKRMKDSIGRTYISELKDLRAQYESLYDQAQFLYVELLMSEKEQLLGRTLHASNKLSEAPTRRIKGWAQDAMSWDGDLKQEYWWDEIGFHIYHEKSECK